MIHIFLRESNQLKYKFTPNYARFKWMARNIFHYVGDERERMKMKRQIINNFIEELSEKKKTQYIDDFCKGRYKSIIAHCKAKLIMETIKLQQQQKLLVVSKFLGEIMHDYDSKKQ
jgi:hypothetical protein